PNWTAIIFFACLSMLHFCISIPAFYHGRIEGYLSFLFANLFLLVSILTYFVRYEIAILPINKRIRLRNRIGPVKLDRHVPFEDVHAVRLTIGGSSTDSTIEV